MSVGTGGNVESHPGAGYFSTAGAICGAFKELTVGPWLLRCVQLIDHAGPHVGLFTWEETDPTTEEER